MNRHIVVSVIKDITLHAIPPFLPNSGFLIELLHEGQSPHTVEWILFFYYIVFLTTESCKEHRKYKQGTKISHDKSFRRIEL